MAYTYETDLLASLLPEWYSLIQSWSTSGLLSSAAQEAFLLDGESAGLTALAGQLSSGDFSDIPEVFILSPEEMNGALGAYDPASSTIFISADFIRNATEDYLFALLTHELGHHIDKILSQQDTIGEEGERFSFLLTGLAIENSSQSSSPLLGDGNWVATDLAVNGYGETLLGGFTASGALDPITAFYSDNQSRQWLRTGESNWQEYVNSVSFSGDEVAVTAGLAIRNNTVSEGSPTTWNGFVYAYDRSGRLLWGNLLGPDIGLSETFATTSDEEGNIYAASLYRVSSDEAPTSVITKFSAEGGIVWEKNILSGEGWVTPYSLASDSAGNVYVAGNGYDADLASSGGVLASISGLTGVIQWKSLIPANVWVTGAAVDAGGNIYIGGTIYSDYEGHIPEQGADFFVAKYNPQGDRQWISFASSKYLYDECMAIAISGDDRIYLGGSSRGSTGNEGDIFIATFDLDGNILRSESIATPSEDDGILSIGTGPNGSMYMAGYKYSNFNGSADNLGYIDRSGYPEKLLVETANSDNPGSAFILRVNSNGIDESNASFLLASTGDIGSAKAGDTLIAAFISADLDGDSNTYSYSWEASLYSAVWETISTSETLNITEDLCDKRIRLSVFYTDAKGFSEKIVVGEATGISYQVTDSPGILSPIGTQGEISSPVGIKLIAGSISDANGSGYTISYSWYHEGKTVEGANDPTLTVDASGFGLYRVAVSYIDSEGFSSTLTSEDVYIGALDKGTGTLQILGLAICGDFLCARFVEGVTLAALKIFDDPDNAFNQAGNVLIYQWYKDGDPIAEVGNAETYQTSATGAGLYWLEVTYKDSKDNLATIASNSITVDKYNNGYAGFEISGTPIAGSTISVTQKSDDPDGNPAGCTYTWQSFDGTAWNAIGSNLDFYKITDAEQGRKIRVLVSYVDGQGQEALVESNELPIVVTSFSGVGGSLLAGSKYDDSYVGSNYGNFFNGAEGYDKAMRSGNFANYTISGDIASSAIESITTSKGKISSYDIASLDSFSNVESIQINAGIGKNVLNAGGVSTGGITRTAYSGTFIAYGNTGVDTITGGSYRNWLAGGGFASGVTSGIESITGTNANNTTPGAIDVFDLRNDTLTGVAYVGGGSADYAKIYNFNGGVDKLVLTGSNADYQFSYVEVKSGGKVKTITDQYVAVSTLSGDLIAQVRGSNLTSLTPTSNADSLLFGVGSHETFGLGF